MRGVQAPTTGQAGKHTLVTKRESMGQSEVIGGEEWHPSEDCHGRALPRLALSAKRSVFPL